MPGRDENWAPGQIRASFSRSAQLYDRASKRGDIVAVPFGRYLLLERIKRGGMAEVYRAKVVGSEGFEKIVAIKRILPHLAANDDFVTMFIDEAKIVSILAHQNICPVIELGRCEDGLYIVMEYIWGRDLRQILNSLSKSGRLMPLTIAAYVAGRIAEGLDYAHRRVGPRGEALGIVHRDISPQNVLISFDGEVKIIDFGIARASQRSTQTRVGTFKGKFAYMSPEQARGKEIDRRSDIFAVGILLHEMITGSRLFAAANDLDTLERVRNCQVPYPTRPFEEVPAELQQIVMKALQPNLEDRWQWSGEMQLALDRFLVRSGELATASRLGTWICLNFAEHAAKTLVDQERAARAHMPGTAPERATQRPPRPSPVVEEPHEDADFDPGPAKSDDTDPSFSAAEIPESSSSVVEPEGRVEFEMEEGLFNFNDNEEFFQGGAAADGSQPVELDPFPPRPRQPQPEPRDWADEAPEARDSRSSWNPEGQEDHAGWESRSPSSEHASWSAEPSEARPMWSGGSEVAIPDGERSHPEVRDSAMPNPQRGSSQAPGQRASVSPSQHLPIPDSFRRSSSSIPVRPSQGLPRPEHKGISVSSSVELDVREADAEDLVVLDDAPPPRSRSGRD